MCRLVFCILFVNSMSLNLAFSPNITGDFNLNALPEKVLAAEPFTNVTKDFSSDITNKADIKSHPYMAGVMVKQVLRDGGVFEKNCTGSFFMFKGRVLTAAHCVVYGRKLVDPDYVIVRLNSNYLDRGGKTMTVTSVDVDKNYIKNEKGVTTISDVAVLRLYDYNPPDDVEEALRLVKVLPLQKTYVSNLDLMNLELKGSVVSVIGYGITKESRKDNSLAEVEINLITPSRCQEMVSELNYRVWEVFHACAYKRGVDVCRGEGGAIMLSARIKGPVAIWSYGRNCGKLDRPAFFAKLAPSGMLFKEAPDEYQYEHNYRDSLLPKELWVEDWEEKIEPEDGDEGKPGNAPGGGGFENASDGGHLSGCSTLSPGLYLFLLIVEITNLGKNN